jgi:two-component sensor histidine kinase
VKRLLEEKELLLQEVHHRIKNNMSTMASVLSLQADAVSDPAAKSALLDARGRMQSMMVLYSKLYITPAAGPSTWSCTFRP